MTATSPEAESLIAAGSQVLVRDAEWLVTQVQHTPTDGLLGHYTAPFTRVDREAAMTRAYETFATRHQAS
jgi:hypothetical protein